MLSRAISMPASTNAVMRSGLEQAGPMVLTIFARRLTRTTVGSYSLVRVFVQVNVAGCSPIGLDQQGCGARPGENRTLRGAAHAPRRIARGPLPHVDRRAAAR